MLGSLNSLIDIRRILDRGSWSSDTEGMSTRCLTLVGFEQDDMPKLYDALEICSLLKASQTVEIFIESVQDFNKYGPETGSGLCLIKIPKLRGTESYRQTLLAITNAVKNEKLTVVPVPDCVKSINELPKRVQISSPYYISINSDVCDFTAMFTAYLFESIVEPEIDSIILKEPHPGALEQTASGDVAGSSEMGKPTIKRRRRAFR